VPVVGSVNGLGCHKPCLEMGRFSGMMPAPSAPFSS